ncbi:putative nuclease HARBI1 [Formica fusca]
MDLFLASEFLESSSSSSEDEILLLVANTKNVKPKIMNYVDTIHLKTDDQFRRDFRLQRNTCSMLIKNFQNNEIYIAYCREDHGGTRISAEIHILSFVWYAANKCAMRDVAERFGVGESTFFWIMNRVMDYLLNLAAEVITFPITDDEKKSAAKNFYKISGFSNTLGCIDGTSIHVRTPAHKIKSTYVNRHDLPSITLQGICNYKKKFIDVFTGPPGKIHDSRVYKLSFISQELPNICGNIYHILGDNAYAIKPWLLTPYRDYGNLSVNKIHYNKVFSGTRVLIENTFGLLKNRFRNLMKLEFQEVDKITKFIMSCCVLHNLCIDYDDTLPNEEYYDENPCEYSELEHMTAQDMHYTRLGQIKRDDICQQLSS